MNTQEKSLATLFQEAFCSGHSEVITLLEISVKANPSITVEQWLKIYRTIPNIGYFIKAKDKQND